MCMDDVKHIFRVVYKRQSFPKPEYKSLHKRILKSHDPVIYSTVSEEIDSIPLAASRLEKFRSSDTVLVIDEFRSPEFTQVPETKLLMLNAALNGFPVMLFKFIYAENSFQIFLDYSRNARLIGEPERADFYLFSAATKHPFMFYINGYFDKGHGGNKTRTYLEQVYYIEYAGKKKVSFTAGVKGLNKVLLKLDNATVIDQRRLFY